VGELSSPDIAVARARPLAEAEGLSVEDARAQLLRRAEQLKEEAWEALLDRDPHPPENITGLVLECLQYLDNEIARLTALTPADFDWPYFGSRNRKTKIAPHARS
jgi:hypothetical protein